MRPWREIPPLSLGIFPGLCLHYPKTVSTHKLSNVWTTGCLEDIDILRQVHARNRELMRVKSIPTEPSENGVSLK